MIDISRTFDEIGGRAKVFYYLLGAEWATAQQTADDLSMSRSQADRLLRNLYEIGVAERRKEETDSPGRPQIEYRINPSVDLD